jgi:hypothetical protein
MLAILKMNFNFNFSFKDSPLRQGPSIGKRITACCRDHMEELLA